MPASVPIAKAELIELDARGEEKPQPRVTVQFNPETLKVSFANQIVPSSNSGAGSGERDTAATQFVGKGTTKLSVLLWFDVNAVLPQAKAGVTDVRQLTKEVAYFITPQPASQDQTKRVPPAVRFRWGTFQFDGIVDAMEESLEFFSADGKPQRASVTLSLSQQAIQFAFAKPAAAGPGGIGLGGIDLSIGTRPLVTASAGDSVQQLAADLGRAGDWQAIAAANGIDNPRQLQPGQLLDLNVNVGVSAGISL
jgi:hypothetical protein